MRTTTRFVLLSASLLALLGLCGCPKFYHHIREGADAKTYMICGGAQDCTWYACRRADSGDLDCTLAREVKQ